MVEIGRVALWIWWGSHDNWMIGVCGMDDSGWRFDNG